MKIKLFTSTVLLLFVFTSLMAQRIYVEKTSDGYEQPIIDKLISEKYKINFKKENSDYTIMCIIGKTGMGRAKGSVAIIDNNSGDMIAKTKEVNGQTSIANGYANPKMIAMKKIADKYLIQLLNEHIKKK